MRMAEERCPSQYKQQTARQVDLPGGCLRENGVLVTPPVSAAPCRNGPAPGNWPAFFSFWLPTQDARAFPGGLWSTPTRSAPCYRGYPRRRQRREMGLRPGECTPTNPSPPGWRHPPRAACPLVKDRYFDSRHHQVVAGVDQEAAVLAQDAVDDGSMEEVGEGHVVGGDHRPSGCQLGVHRVFVLAPPGKAGACGKARLAGFLGGAVSCLFGGTPLTTRLPSGMWRKTRSPILPRRVSSSLLRLSFAMVQCSFCV
jgi:hypothetical protein